MGRQTRWHPPVTVCKGKVYKALSTLATALSHSYNPWQLVLRVHIGTQGGSECLSLTRLSVTCGAGS